MSSSLAIVEKKPPLNGGGCAGGVLFHLLDWHRRLARKRRLLSPRRLIPASLRSAPRRLPAALPPAPPPPRPPAPNPAVPTDGPAPGVVARLMGLESWPGGGGASGGSPVASRPQKQRKVEPPEVDSAVVLVLPATSRRHPAPLLAPAAAPRSHHGSDLPARSPRRTRLVHAAAAKLLEPGTRASSRASARLALAYACSSPQHRSGPATADDFLSRSGSMSLERSTRFQPPPPPPVPEPEEERDRSRRHEHQSIGSGDAVIGTPSCISTVVLPRMDFGAPSRSKSSHDVDAVHKERRARNEGMSTCAKVRSSSPSGRAGDERLRKRGTPTRPEVSASVNPVSLASSTASQSRHSRDLISAGRRVAHSSSGPRRECMGSVTGQGITNHRDVMNRSGSPSASRSSTNGPEPKRLSRKNVGRVTAASNTDDRNAVVFASRLSVKPVARSSSHNNVSKSGRPSRRASSTTCAETPAADPKCIQASASVMGGSENDEFRRLLKAKIDELGMSDRLQSSDARSGRLPTPVLQELISALTNDMNTSTSQNTNYFDASAPLHSNGNGGCIDQSGYAFSDDQSPCFQKCYQGEQDVDSSAASISNEPNQPSPVSVLETCFSNDTSSLGSPVEKNGKDLFLPMEKMEDLFNLEADIVDLKTSVDTTKASADEIFHGNRILSCSEDFAAHDFKFLESRLHSIREALSNVELLLGTGLMQGTTSAFALRPFIMEMVETTLGVFGGEESLVLTEEKHYQHTNFLFDCIVELLDSKFGNFGKCGFKAWSKLSIHSSKAPLSKDLLKQELLEVIGNWKESGAALSRVAEKELDQTTTSWVECQIEVFDISVAVEDDVLEALVVELVLDLL